MAVLAIGGVHQSWEHGCEFSDSLVHAGSGPLLLLVLAEQVPAADGVGRRPWCPAAGVFEGPGSQVGVEGANGHEDGVGILSQLAYAMVAVTEMAESLLPPPGHVVGQMQRLDPGSCSSRSRQNNRTSLLASWRYAIVRDPLENRAVSKADHSLTRCVW